MTARKAVVTALLAVALAVPANSADIVYVQTETAGVYAAQKGEIIEITPTQLVLATPTGRVLYRNEAVQRVDLESETGAPNDKHANHLSLIRRYWNVEASPIVKAVRALPVVGQPLGALDRLIPAPTATAFATLALLLGLLWLAYKGYELTVVSRETHRLTRLRLQIEIAKLRHETIDLAKRLNSSDLSVLLALVTPLPEVSAASDVNASELTAPLQSPAMPANPAVIDSPETPLVIPPSAVDRRITVRKILLLIGAMCCILGMLFTLLFTLGAIIVYVQSSATSDLLLAALGLTLSALLGRQAVRLARGAGVIHLTSGKGPATSVI